MADATHSGEAGTDAAMAAFAETAARAAEACAGLDLRAQAARLAEDGLLGILAAEDVGGLALPLAYALPVIEAVAAARLSFPLVETVLLARAMEEVDPVLATALCEGRVLGTVAWRAAADLGADGRLQGRARAPHGAAADRILVPTRDGRAVLVDRAAASPDPGGPDDLDPTRPQARLAFEGATAGQDRILGDAGFRRLREDALLLRTAAIAGASATCLALAVEHATTRQQFGKPLSANQAIRHNLARQKLTLEGMRAALGRAASLGVGPGATVARLAAFGFAARGGTAIAEAAIQVHGGMGYTWEVPLHWHLRRVKALAAEGDAPAAMDDLAGAVLAAAA